jgi:hypothetical protein
MKPNTTAIWFVLAVLLAAAIWFLEDQFQPAAPREIFVFAGLRAGKVTGVQIIPAGAREISAVRTNQIWLLEKPFAYPAQAAAIDRLLGVLEKLSPSLPISAAEMSGHKDADADYGFDNPQFRLDVTAGAQTWHLNVGNKTAPGDGVFVRVVGATGAFVTDPGWLQFLPRDANDWRDTTLVDVPAAVDWIVVTNGAKAIELRRDATNRLWRMVRPLQASADSLRIVTGLQQLRAAKAEQFVSDDPKADLAGYGLDPAALDVWLGSGTNLLTALHAGKEVNGNPALIFARRDGWNAIVATAKEPLAPWRGTVIDFRDPNLLELTAPVAEIEVRGQNNFTLQQRASNVWNVVGEKFPTDAEQVNAYLRMLGNLRIADFVQDVVTGPGLQNFGLASPSQQITLRSVAGNTNSIIAQLLLGATSTNEIYVKRAGEDFVYGLSLADLSRLTLPGDYFRDHHVWNFSETNVASVTLRQNGKTRQLLRTGTNEWTLAAGQGIINPPAIEETVHRLGDLTALAWIGRKFTDADIGRTTNGLSIAIELKSGEKHLLEFGQNVQVPSLNAQTAEAAVMMDGERWAFVFPPVLYPLVADYLTIPPDAP